MHLTPRHEFDSEQLVDFAAGLVFGLHGSIERVTQKVFLLSPANVDVMAEDKSRIAEGGFFNHGEYARPKKAVTGRFTAARIQGEVSKGMSVVENDNYVAPTCFLVSQLPVGHGLRLAVDPPGVTWRASSGRWESHIP